MATRARSALAIGQGRPRTMSSASSWLTATSRHLLSSPDDSGSLLLAGLAAVEHQAPAEAGADHRHRTVDEALRVPRLLPQRHTPPVRPPAGVVHVHPQPGVAVVGERGLFVDGGSRELGVFGEQAVPFPTP